MRSEDSAHSLANSIFISYRRDDTRESAGRIYDWLDREFSRGMVFKDVDSIPFGVDFADHLTKVLAQCRVVLVLIGAKWSSICDQEGNRRLDHSGDYVRLEVEAALARDGIRVIPVLVGGTRLPSSADLPDSLKPLRKRNTADMRHDPDFTRDMSRLIHHIKEALQDQLPSETPTRVKLPAHQSSQAMQTMEVPMPFTSHASDSTHPTEGWEVTMVAPGSTGARIEGAPPDMPVIELRFHRHCIAGMQGVFQVRAANRDWRPLRGATLTLRSSSFQEHEVQADLFPLLPGETSYDTFPVAFAAAGPGTIRSCTLQIVGPWGVLKAEGRWPAEFPVLSYEAAVAAARSGGSASITQHSRSDEDRLNAYLMQELTASFVRLRFDEPRLSVEVLPEEFQDLLLGMPMRKVNISRGVHVWFAQYPVRQKDWSRFMNGSLATQGSKTSNAALDGENRNCPMHYVNLEEAKAFCQTLNEEAAAAGIVRPGYVYRLPTAQEWRIACGGEPLSELQLHDVAWHGGRELNSCQAVGRLQPNAAGLYDMRGNVFEWCLPDVPEANKGFIAGGSWFNHPNDRKACQTGQPGPCPAETRSSRIGLRVVLARMV